MTWKPPDIVSPKEFADVLGVSARTIQRRLRQGRIQADRTGIDGGDYLIPVAELQRCYPLAWAAWCDKMSRRQAAVKP